MGLIFVDTGCNTCPDMENTKKKNDELKELLKRYEELCFKKELTEEDRAKRAELRIKFKNLSAELSGAARERFEDIERRRKTND